MPTKPSIKEKWFRDLILFTCRMAKKQRPVTSQLESSFISSEPCKIVHEIQSCKLIVVHTGVYLPSQLEL